MCNITWKCAIDYNYGYFLIINIITTIAIGVFSYFLLNNRNLVNGLHLLPTTSSLVIKN
jgi:hypothetical protein